MSVFSSLEAQTALWLLLALLASVLSIWFKIATSLLMIMVGSVAQLIIGNSPVTSPYFSMPQGAQ